MANTDVQTEFGGKVFDTAVKVLPVALAADAVYVWCNPTGDTAKPAGQYVKSTKTDVVGMLRALLPTEQVAYLQLGTVLYIG